MSTILEPSCSSEGRKIHLSFTLKMPIDIELELSSMPEIHFSQLENKEFYIQKEDSESAVVMNGEAQLNDDRNIEALSTQIVAQLLQTLPTVPQTQPQQNNPLPLEDFRLGSRGAEEHGSTGEEMISVTLRQEESKDKEISGEVYNRKSNKPDITPPSEKNSTVRLLDSLNNGFTLAVNVVGTVLFLGKLANYSWE
jgi:hypothetical protein